MTGAIQHTPAVRTTRTAWFGRGWYSTKPMRDVLERVNHWLAAGHGVALATVVRTWGSAPRPLGSKMAISSAGDISGSVSGGCVEGAVVEQSRAVLETGLPRLLRYGVTNEQAWEVGLSCGGTIEVFIEPLPPSE